MFRLPRNGDQGRRGRLAAFARSTLRGTLPAPGASPGPEGPPGSGGQPLRSTVLMTALRPHRQRRLRWRVLPVLLFLTGSACGVDFLRVETVQPPPTTTTSTSTSTTTRPTPTTTTTRPKAPTATTATTRPKPKTTAPTRVARTPRFGPSPPPPPPLQPPHP